MNKRVLVKFKSNWAGGPMLFTVPEERVSTLATMDDVDWVSTTDASQYFTPPIRVNEVSPLDRNSLAKAIGEMRNHSKIQATKTVRGATNCTLKEAKDLCDELDLQFNLTSYDDTKPRSYQSYCSPYYDEDYDPEPSDYGYPEEDYYEPPF